MRPSSHGAIGIFDSGYGGLTIFDEIVKLLPTYDYIYLGDNARTPYGTRSFEVVYEFTRQAVFHLIDKGCPLVILACNTASAKALRTIQQVDLPRLAPDARVLGVIRPTAEVIGDITCSGKVGILGTVGTIQSESYPIEIGKLFPHITVYGQACPMWVPLVENNEYDSPGADYFIKRYIDELMAQDSEIDTIVLGCTHFPLLAHKIYNYLPAHVQLIAQGAMVASSLQDYLHRHPEMEQRCTRQGATRFLTTENPDRFIQSASTFLHHHIKAERVTLE